MTSLSRNARIAGLFYLTLLTAPLRLIYIPTKLFVAGNASATADNIAAHETLFRLGIVSDLFTATMDIFLTLALYRLFEGVDKGLARLMVILGTLMLTPIYFLNTINDTAALLLARGTDFLSVFDKPQRDALVILFLRIRMVAKPEVIQKRVSRKRELKRFSTETHFLEAVRTENDFRLACHPILA
jgi:hypothetical protein